MNCPSCGNQIAAGGTFCGRCGTRVESNQAPSSPHGIKLDTDGQGTGRGYIYEILHQPAFSLAVLKLQAEQWLKQARWSQCRPMLSCNRR